MKNKQKARRRCAVAAAVLLCIVAILPVLFIPAAAEEAVGPLTPDEAPLLKFRFNLAPGVRMQTPLTSVGNIYNPSVDTTLPSFYLNGRDAFIVCKIDKSGYYVGEKPRSEYCTFYVTGGSGNVCGISLTGGSSTVTQTFLVDVNFRYCVFGDNYNLTEPSEDSFYREFNQVRISLGSFSASATETKTRSEYGWVKLYKGSELVSQYRLQEFSAYYYLNEYFRCYSNTLFSMNAGVESDTDSFVSVSSPAMLHAFNAGESSIWASGIIRKNYEKGYSDGITVGEALHADDYKNGFAAGQTDAMNSTHSLKDMVFAIFSAPAYFINGILDFDLFGINLATLVKTLITLVAVALVIIFLLKLMKR